MQIARGNAAIEELALLTTEKEMVTTTMKRKDAEIAYWIARSRELEVEVSCLRRRIDSLAWSSHDYPGRH